MKKFSIIIPTIGRTIELDNLLQSIIEQNYAELEIIVVNQNKEINIDNIIDKYSEILKIYNQKVDFKGAARARNYGSKKATGDIFVFPDDDATIAPNVFKYVDEIFSQNGSIQAVFGMVKDKESNKNILHFKKKDTYIKLCNLYQTTIETSMFIKKEVFKNSGMYDENFGIGTYFGAEEGADLVSRLLYNKTKMKYIATPFFYHPNKREYDLLDRAYSYNLGFGALVYKHIKEYKRIYPMLFYFILKLLKNVVGILTAIITLRKDKLQYHIISFKGKIKGIVEKRKDYVK